MSVDRDTLLRTARAYAMWPTSGDEDAGTIACSCGFTSPVMWIDDVVTRDIAKASHGIEFVIAYPGKAPESSIGGVRVSVNGTGAWPVSARHLAWLLAQPDLPDEFRRAAAVHLKS